MSKYTVSMNENEIEIDGITFIVKTRDGYITVEIDGGYGQDDDGEYMEIDGGYRITSQDLDFEIDDYDQEFEVEITAADVKKAQEYRAVYPAEIED